MDFWLIAFVIVVIVIGLLVFQHLAHRKKVDEFTAYANQRGWQYAERDNSLVDRFDGSPFGTGHGRRAQHVLRGRHRDRDALAFEYMYKETTGSGDDRKTETYYFTVVALATPASRPTLEIRGASCWVSSASATSSWRARSSTRPSTSGPRTTSSPTTSCTPG